MADGDKEQRERDELSEIGDGAVVALSSLTARRILEALFAYLVIGVAGPAFYGLLSIFIRMEQLVGSMTGGVRSGIKRTLPRLKQDEQNAVLTIIIPVLFALWLVIATAVFMFDEQIIAETILEQSHRPALYVFALSLLPFTILMTVASVFKSHKQIRLANIVWTIAKPLALLIGTAAGLLLFTDSLTTVWGMVSVASTATATLALALLAQHTTHRPLNPRAAWDDVAEFLGYIRDTTVSTVFGVIQYQGIFILMAVFLSSVNAGLFSLSFVLAGIVRWPLSSVNQIFPPIMSELYGEDKITILKRLYQRTSLIILYAALPPTAIALIYDQQILTTFSAAYTEAAVVLPILAVGQLVASAAGSVGLLLQMTDHHRETMWLQIGIVITTMPVVVWLTLTYGLVGLAVGTFLLLFVNNATEILLLRWETILFPFTRRHLEVSAIGCLMTVSGHAVVATLPLLASILFVALLVVGYYTTIYYCVLETNDIYMLTVIWSTVRTTYQ